METLFSFIISAAVILLFLRGYLKSLKIDLLKVDGSYIRRLETSADNRFFVQAVSEIAHGLEIRVIAESIETEAEWDAVRALHVDGAQGYYLGQPGPRR